MEARCRPGVGPMEAMETHLELELLDVHLGHRVVIAHKPEGIGRHPVVQHEGCELGGSGGS